MCIPPPSTSCRMKVEAMREDDNVFDVSFEGMGTDEPTASATDVKVGDCV